MERKGSTTILMAIKTILCAVTGAGTIPEWVQPTGTTDAYRKCDQVRHVEKIWTSDIDGNAWEPGVYGWTETL